MIRQHTRTNRFLARRAGVLLCVFSITVAPVAIMASTSPVNGTEVTSPLTINAAAAKIDWRQAAQEYDSAMRLISQVATMSLKNPEDVAKAIELLRKAAPGIRRGSVAIMIQTAAADATFQSAVQASVARKCGTLRELKPFVSCVTDFVNEAAKNRSAFDGAGGSAAVRTIQSRLKADAELLKRVSANLTNAIKTLRPQTKNLLNPDKGLVVAVETQKRRVRNHENPRLPFDSLRVNFVVPEPAAAQGHLLGPEIVLFIYISMPVCGAVGAITLGMGYFPCLISAVEIALAIIVADWLVRKGEDFLGKKPRVVTNPDTGQVEVEEKTDFEVCKEWADGTKENCLGNAGNDPWKSAGCWAEWSLRMAECLVVPWG